MARLLLSIGWEIGPAVFLSHVGVNASMLVGPLLFAWGIRPLVDGVVQADSDQIAVGAIATALALAMSIFAPVGYRWATVRMRERSLMVIQHRLLRLSTTAPRLEHFERPAFWDRLQVLQRSARDLGMGIALVVSFPIVLIQIIVTAALLGQLEPVLLFLPIVAIPAAWLVQWSERLERTAEMAAAEDRRMAQRVFTIASAPASSKEVRLYGLQTELLDRHRRSNQAVCRRIEAGMFAAAGVKSLGWSLFAVAYVGAVVTVLRLAANGSATAGDVAISLALAAAMVMSAGRLTELAGSAHRMLTLTEHYHWLATQAESPTVGDPTRPPSRLAQGIGIENVSFSYGDDSQPSLSDVTLHLPANRVVAIVGENGAGKTTLVKLLCGMYQPTTGRVTIDGLDLSTLNLDEYRQRISAGFQDHMRFELLVREAVGIGHLPYIEDAGAVDVALTKASAEFVANLPAGQETQLGLSWQGGVDLSGGEWQKLALARSVLRPDPLLVGLDEPTASLDPQAEHALFEQIAADSRKGAADGRITLLISHRFSTVRMADLIVVLENGKVLEQGSHEQLMARNGLYAELFRLQANAYR